MPLSLHCIFDFQINLHTILLSSIKWIYSIACSRRRRRRRCRHFIASIYDIAPFSTPINSIKFSPSQKRIISDKMPFLRGNLAADIYMYVCTLRPNYKSLNNFVRFIAFLLHIFALSMRLTN